jgi:large subunit ribosomal protein L39
VLSVSIYFWETVDVFQTKIIFNHSDISEMLLKRSAVAEVDGELWDLHRPLEEACTLKLLHMKVEDAHQAALVNRTFWRSCSFLLGAIVEGSFKDNIQVILHSFPSANVRSGSFVYDVDLGQIDWDPTQVF